MNPGYICLNVVEEKEKKRKKNESESSLSSYEFLYEKLAHNKRGP